jgi:hypothetical protein
MCRPGRGDGLVPTPCPLRGQVDRGVRHGAHRRSRIAGYKNVAMWFRSSPCRRPPLSGSFHEIYATLPPSKSQANASDLSFRPEAQAQSLARPPFVISTEGPGSACFASPLVISTGGPGSAWSGVERSGGRRPGGGKPPQNRGPGAALPSGALCPGCARDQARRCFRPSAVPAVPDRAVGPIRGRWSRRGRERSCRRRRSRDPDPVLLAAGPFPGACRNPPQRVAHHRCIS